MVGPVLVKGRGRRVVLILLSVILFAAGSLVLTWYHATATQTQQRPTVTASLVGQGDNTVVTTAVAAEGMKPDQYLVVLVQGLNSRRYLELDRAQFAQDSPEVEPGLFFKQRIYIGRIGPNTAGEVDSSIDVQLNGELYDQIAVQAGIADSETGPGMERDLLGVPRPDEDGGSGEVRRFACNSDSSRVSCATVLLPAPATEPKP